MTRHTNRSMTASPARRGGLARRLGKALAALVALTVVIVGVPVLLISLGLAPHALPSVHDVTTSLRSQDSSGLYFVIAGAAAVWIAWLVFTAITVMEIAVSVRLHGPRPSLPHTGLGKLAPAALVATIAVLFVAAPAASTMLGAHASADPALAARATSSVSIIADARSAAPIANAPDTAHSHRTGLQRHASPTYTVQRYDTLWNIAAHHLPGNPADRYRDIARLNSDAIGPDNEITPSTVLQMPADAHGLPAEPTSSDTDASTGTADTVTVHEGDTLSGLAAEHGVTDWEKVWPANDGRAEPDGQHLQNPNLIRPGWTITLPGSPTTTTPTTTTPGTSTPQTPPKSTVPPARTIPSASTPSTTPRTTPTQQTAPSSTPSQTPASQQPAPRTQTPAHTPAVPASPAATRPADAPTRHVEQAPAAHSSSSTTENTVVAFAGGGVLLAGVSLTALVYRRRRQFQRRRPGRTVSGSPPELVGMERAVLAAGSAGLADVTWLDAALRSLVQTTAEQPGGTLPDVIAVRLTDVDLTLVLTGAAPNPPAPWRVISDDATRWSIRREDTLPYDESRRGSYFAPFPTLTSVGYTADGERWMLDLERIAALSLCGDAERCVNLARFLAAELAHNTWSEMLQVTLVGFGAELVEANPDRLTFTEDLAAATAAVSNRLSSVTSSMGALDTDVLNGRVHDIVGDEWAPNVLLIAPHLAGDTDALDELLAAMKRQHARASVALVLADDPDRADATRWQLTVDAEGNMSIPALGLELIAQQIPSHEAAPLAQMLAYAAVSEDEPIGPAHDDQPWDRYSDACGGLIVSADTGEHGDTDQQDGQHPGRLDDEDRPGEVAATQRRRDDAAAVPVLHQAESSPWMRNSVLPLSPQTYLERAATTPEDLSALAPVVNDRIRDEIERADPDLDVDLQAWDDPASPRPKLTLLGTTRVRAKGSLPVSPQVEFHTEIVALLAGRSRGVPSPEFAETLWPNDPDIVGKSKVRGYARSTRKWLGKDPETGQDYLPSGVYDGRVARYRIDGLLCDAHLFRRLRLRAEARGADGIDDLWRALRLVQGAPFGGIKIAKDEDGRPGGWGWFINANHRLDFEYLAMIVDTAHTVADYHLGAGEPERAAEAAQVALRSGAYDDVPLLDLVAACLAQEQQAEAESYVQQLLSNAGVEREADLEPRTAEVLSRLRRRWHDRAS